MKINVYNEKKNYSFTVQVTCTDWSLYMYLQKYRFAEHMNTYGIVKINVYSEKLISQSLFKWHKRSKRGNLLLQK